MELKRHGVGSAVYDYPVELVWRGIAGGKSVEIQPLNEDEYAAEPPANTMLS